MNKQLCLWTSSNHIHSYASWSSHQPCSFESGSEGYCPTLRTQLYPSQILDPATPPNPLSHCSPQLPAQRHSTPPPQDLNSSSSSNNVLPPPRGLFPQAYQPPQPFPRPAPRSRRSPSPPVHPFHREHRDASTSVPTCTRFEPHRLRVLHSAERLSVSWSRSRTAACSCSCGACACPAAQTLFYVRFAEEEE
jgi:hypothetical protein